MHNDGKDYEKFVAILQQALLNAENITMQKVISIELNKRFASSEKSTGVFTLCFGPRTADTGLNGITCPTTK